MESNPATLTNSLAAQTTVYEARGTHLLLTLSGCLPQLLNNEEALRELAQQAATAAGATVLQVASHKFQPQGVTVMVLLAESHASLHAYPEHGVVFRDCFTCGQLCRPELSTHTLVERLQPKSINEQLVTRGR